MSFDPVTGGPCAVADIRRGALRDIAQVLKEHQKRKEEQMTTYTEWRNWFAWYPVVIDGKDVWGHIVQRRRVEVPIGTPLGTPVYSVFWQYRVKP